MISRLAFLRRMAAVALSCAFFDGVRLPQIDAIGVGEGAADLLPPYRYLYFRDLTAAEVASWWPAPPAALTFPTCDPTRLT